MLLVSAISVAVFLFLLFCGCLCLSVRNARRVKAHIYLLQQQFKSLGPQIQALLSADISLNKRFREFQVQYDRLSEYLDQSQQTKQVTSYAQAIKLAEMGANLNDIRSTCQLSTAECELLLNLQGHKQNATHQNE